MFPAFTSLHIDEAREIFKNLSIKPFRADQVAEWAYGKFVTDPSKMTNLSEDVRTLLCGRMPVSSVKVEKTLKSAVDGSVKLLLKAADGVTFETVIMPEKDGRNTVCVSTQAGCPVGCSFCASGAGGFERNLDAGEIIGQILMVGTVFKPEKDKRPVNNVLFMGMGEPLLNIDSVTKAIKIMNAEWGFGIGLNRITLSTAIAFKKNLEALVASGAAVNLAVSLHAGDDATRKKIVPKSPISINQMVDNAFWYKSTTGKELTFEYVLISGVNASLSDAFMLSKALAPYSAKVNLIECNPVPKLGMKPPARVDTLAFQTALADGGVRSFIRESHGGDIDAACGQLKMTHGKH